MIRNNELACVPDRGATLMRRRMLLVAVGAIAGAGLWCPATVAEQAAPNEAATELYNSGLEHLQAGRWPQAIDIFKQAIAKDAKDADAHPGGAHQSEQRQRLYALGSRLHLSKTISERG